MGIFGFGNRNDSKPCCCSSTSCESTANTHRSTQTFKQDSAADRNILVLGMGCPKCKILTETTQHALEALNMDTTVKHITDLAVISEYGVMSTPALVINGKVVSVGKVLKKEEIMCLIQAACE